MFPPEERLEFAFFSKGVMGSDPWESFRWKVQNCSQLCRTAPVWRGPTTPRQLPHAEQPLDLKQIFVDADQKRSVEDCLADGHTEALIVVHKGVVLVEKYFNDTQAHTKEVLCSVSKSFIGIVLANLVEEGLLTYDTKVVDVLPELQGTAWEEVTVRHATLQATGVNSLILMQPGDALWKDLQATGLEVTPAGEEAPLLLDAVRECKEKVFPAGTYFQYNEVNAHVTAWACQRLTGLKWPDLVSKYIWQKIGAAEDAFFLLDSAGIADDGAGMNSTAMDLARYGLALMHNDDPNTLPSHRICPPGYFAKIVEAARTSPCVAAANDPTNVINSPFIDELLGYAHYCLLARYGSYDTILAAGLLGQVNVMQPDLDVLITRIGSSGSMDDLPHCRMAFTAILEHVAGLKGDGST